MDFLILTKRFVNNYGLGGSRNVFDKLGLGHKIFEGSQERQPRFFDIS